MKKLVTTLLATTAAALGLFFAGSANADASTNYTVKSGDSVWAISQKFDTTIDAIENANNIQAHLILPGEKLVIPDANSAATTTAAPAQQTTTATATQQPAATTQQSTQTYSQPAASTQTQTTSSAANYNGGSTKSYVLSQMASRTGVPASTWNYIIQRESNWQPSVRNSSSGAYGLFQNMHISGGSVQDQVNAAVSLYHSQGMGAWSM
ncbi:peptidoglycan-binding protein [Lentilactobacillus curieae]|uniref:Peptidoglycan-binding protein n=1 Tax=Lentilactobacillus curieae TaxID=1138822 RepID=A0A1S6QIP8_9LACO|nr:LysM peptidoglycan-binding domain-containing protein [Lentilactobacillus curieae]AQW21484.1 peptidoglycan-binding protein [Lentilactobacillus curieae]